MNKIGNIDIKKAYLGTKSLSYNNAFVGTYHLITIIPESNKLLYTSSDGNIITPYTSVGMGIVSNTYEDGIGIISCSRPITRIPKRCFSIYRLKTITLPECVTSIGESAFSGSGLTNINLPEGLLYIEVDAFTNTYLQSITLPSTIEHLYDRCFRSCSSLTNISYNGTIEQWNNVRKGNWHPNTPATVVHCSDGDVAI